MALKPDDLKLTPEEVDLAAKYEKAIDTDLLEQYSASKKQYVVNVWRVQEGSRIPIRVENEVARRYKEAGWSTFEFDPIHLKVILFK